MPAFFSIIDLSVQPNEYNDNSDLKEEVSLSLSLLSFGHTHTVAERTFAFIVAQSSRSFSIYVHACLAMQAIEWGNS